MAVKLYPWNRKTEPEMNHYICCSPLDDFKAVLSVDNREHPKWYPETVSIFCELS
jgi:hypothetical protein